MSAKLKLVDSESGVISRLLEIAEKRRNTLLALKTAIRDGEFAEADRLVTELVPDEKSGGANPRKYRVAGR